VVDSHPPKHLAEAGSGARSPVQRLHQVRPPSSHDPGSRAGVQGPVGCAYGVGRPVRPGPGRNTHRRTAVRPARPSIVGGSSWLWTAVFEAAQVDLARPPRAQRPCNQHRRFRGDVCRGKAANPLWPASGFFFSLTKTVADGRSGTGIGTLGPSRFGPGPARPASPAVPRWSDGAPGRPLAHGGW